MKKLRLISFMLAFVMVVAMMVPALAILVAADGDTLPGGDTIPAWNIGFPGGKVSTDPTKAVTETIDNVHKDAAWAGAAYQLQALKGGKTQAPVHDKFAESYSYALKNVDADNFYGIMFDFANTGSNANNAFAVALVVDGQAYFALGNNGTAAEFVLETGANSYFKGADGVWTTVSNVDYTFSGALAPTLERGTRYPGGTVGSWFVPVESFTKIFGECDVAGYNANWQQNPEVLTTEAIAAASEITLVIGVVWNGADIIDVTAANTVYSTDWVAPIPAPTVLPGADTAEWIGHAGYGAAGLAKFPSVFSMDTTLVGKNFTVSDNLLAEPIATPEGGGDQFANADVAAVPADANLAGLLLKVSAGGASANNGTMFGFTANGNRYAVANNFAGMNDGTVKMAVPNPVYLFDGVTQTWTWYRDNYSHCTLRTPASATTWVFIPLDAIRVNTAAAGARPVVELAYGNAAADLITAGISNVEFSKSWGDQITLNEVQYVYVKGYDSQAVTLPGANVTGFNLGFADGSIKTDRAALGNIASFDYATAWAGADYEAMEAATKLDAVLQSKFMSSYKYTLPATVAGSDIVGFKLAYANESLLGNNVAVVFQLKVDDVVYYSVSYNDTSLVYYTWANSNKWYAASNRHMPFANVPEGAAETERATRLPGGLAGELFIPVESFYTAFTGGLDGYNGTKAETETQLTGEILAAATSIELYASTTWGDGVFTDGAVVTKGAYVIDAPAGDKPTVLPAPDGIKFRTDYNGNFWKEDVVADNAVTPIDGIWGAEFVTTGIAVEEVTGAKWADLGGVLLTVNNAEKAAATFAMNFKHTQTVAGTDADGNPTETIKERNYTFTTAKGFGAKPIYLWQGGNAWAVEGAGDTFTIPAGYVGYVYIPVTALTGSDVNAMDTATANADPGFYTTLFSDFLADIGGSVTFTGAALAGVEATAEFVWIDGLGELINNGEAEKPTNFPVLGETAVTGHATAYNYIKVVTAENATDAFTFAYTPFTAYGFADAPASTTPDGKKLTSLERSLSTKFSGSAMITEPLVSVGGVLNTGKTLTMTVDGTPTINAATAAGLLFKVNIETALAQGLGLDFAITVGGNVYRFFNNAQATSYDAPNGMIYMYNNVNDYADCTWTATHGDSKIRIPTSFDGYVLVPFALLRNGAEALDMNTLASAGISEVTMVGYWADSVMTVESVEVASVPATLANSSITIGNDITLNANAIVTGTPTSVKANFIMGETTVTVDGVAGENGFYNFALTGIGAHLMMDKIDIELVVDDAIVSRVDDYTIAEYVAKVLRSSDETKVKKVAADLLYYGDAVQNFLGYNTANLATSVLTTEELDNRSNNMINKIKDEVEIAGAISNNVQWKGATVLPVDGGLSIVFKAVVIDATDVAIAVKKGEATETFTADKWGVVDNEYVVVFNNIAITELATKLTATFAKGTATEGATLTASTNAILAAIADKNSGASQIEKEYVICLYALSNSLANFAK